MEVLPMKRLLPLLLLSLLVLASCARRTGPVYIEFINANALPLPVAQSTGPAMVPVSMSGDGKWLLTTDDQHAGLYLTNLQTEHTRTITQSYNTGYYASFTPDGSRVAFKAFRHDYNAEPGIFEQAAFLHDVDTNLTQRITAWSPVVGTPAASVTGRVAVSVGDDIVVLTRDLRQLSRYPVGHCSNLIEWSPDETQIAFGNKNDHPALLDLATGDVRVLINDGQSHYGPVFSPDGDRLLFRTFTSYFSVIELPAGTIHRHGYGDEPTWLDNDTIAFVEEQETLKARSALDPDAEAITLGSPGVRWYTLSSSWTAGRRGDDLLVHRIAGNTSLDRTHRLDWIRQDDEQIVPYEPHRGPADQHAYRLPPHLVRKPHMVELIGVPYIHQTRHLLPGYDGDWACNATCAVMLLATHRAIDPIDDQAPALDGAGIAARGPSPFSRYITEEHSAGDVTFSIESPGPDGKPMGGAYGYIVREDWKDTRNYMADYMRAHGLRSEVDWQPRYDTIVNSIDRGQPIIVLHLITYAGHYTNAIGYLRGKRAIVMNDPYGDKNSRFYPHEDGRRAIYDLPGYNNGYQNLRMVRCLITGTPPNGDH
jgi:hypothetical protein